MVAARVPLPGTAVGVGKPLASSCRGSFSHAGFEALQCQPAELTGVLDSHAEPSWAPLWALSTAEQPSPVLGEDSWGDPAARGSAGPLGAAGTRKSRTWVGSAALWTAGGHCWHQ